MKRFYVEISRARDRAELVTDDVVEFRAQLQAATGERIAPLEGTGEPDDGWENLASVGHRIQGALSEFDPRSYGCVNLSALVEKCGGFDIRKDRGVVYVRRKTDARKGLCAVNVRSK